MRFNLVKVLPDAIDAISPKECYSLGELGCTKDLIKLSTMKNKDSICLGFTEGGKLLGVAGSYRVWAGSAQAWGVFDRAVDKFPKSLTEVCLSLILYAQKTQELKRISLTVREGFKKGDRFASVLGFEQEGSMKRYLPDGGDARLYARLF